ncbi:M48 family metallopeptidase [Salinispira pacifica]
MKRIVTVLFMLQCSLLLPLYAQQSVTDTELQSYIERQSEIWFEQELKGTGTIDPGAWKLPIESAFLRIANSSGRAGARFSYAVLKARDFNAACFPGGQFVINAGTLQTLDAVISSRLKTVIDRIDGRRLQTLREALIAPVIAHELGHFFCRHTYQAMKMQWSSTRSQDTSFDVRMLTFTQANELEADKTGYLLLKQAGYDPNLMVALLEVLNQIHQAELKEVPSDSFNTYLASHPSPHARLAAFQNEDQKLHQWAAELERAFSDAQLGTNLGQALSTVEEGLKTVPNNLYLEKERAVILHKLWLATVPLKEQKLRAIIDTPSFRDDMVFRSAAGTRGLRKTIPGDRRAYLKAREAYVATYERSNDPGFDSNFALLLAYSPSEDDEAAAVKLAAAAAKAQGSLENVSNYAAVLYLVGREKEGTSVLEQVAAQFDDSYGNMFAAAATDPGVLQSLRSYHSRLRMSQALNRDFVTSDFTPLLNFALCLAYAGRTADARKLASIYLTDYESGSSWAEYLASTAGVSIPKPPERDPKGVQGVRIGTPITAVVDRWGKATTISSAADGTEIWGYDGRHAELEIEGGEVRQIALNAAESPKVENSFGVGASRADIEKIIGKPKRQARAYTIYEGPQNFAVLYTNNVAQQIILFP